MERCVVGIEVVVLRFFLDNTPCHLSEVSHSASVWCFALILGNEFLSFYTLLTSRTV